MSQYVAVCCQKSTKSPRKQSFCQKSTRSPQEAVNTNLPAGTWFLNFLWCGILACFRPRFINMHPCVISSDYAVWENILFIVILCQMLCSYLYLQFMVFCQFLGIHLTVISWKFMNHGLHQSMSNAHFCCSICHCLPYSPRLLDHWFHQWWKSWMLMGALY